MQTRQLMDAESAPELLAKADFGAYVRVSAADFPTRDLAAQHMVVGFRVDESGAPQNVHLVKSVSQTVDARVLAAVRQYRFVPGTLDDRNVPVDVNLVINLHGEII